MGLFDDVPAPQFYGRQAVIPATAGPSSTLLKKPDPNQRDLGTQIVDKVAETFLPSQSIKAMHDPSILGSTGHFIAGLGQQAVQAITFFPKALFKFAKSDAQTILSGGKNSDLLHSVDQGYKEAGLAGEAQVGLSEILPFATALLGGVSAPAMATPTQLFESLLTGGLGFQTKGATTATKELPAETATSKVIQEQPKVLEAPAPKLVEENPVSPGTETVSNTLSDTLKDQILRDNTPPQPAKIVNNILSVGDRLAELGPAGRELLSQINKYFEQPGLKAGDFTADLVDKINGFSRDELYNLKAVMQGRGKPLNPNVEVAANLARAQTDIISNLAQANIPGWNPIKNYFTQSLVNASDLGNKQIVSEVIDNMVNLDKTVGSRAEAVALLDSWKTYLQKGELTQPLIDYVKKTKQIDIADEAGFKSALQTKLNAFTKPSFKFGPFEARSLDLPFYDPNPARVLPKYYETSFEFLHKLENWGPAGQKLYDLVNLIGEQGGRNTDLQLANNVVDFLVKGDTADAAVRMLRDNLLKYNAATKMPLSFISNTFQGFLGTAMYGDLKSALKMITKFKDPENIDFSIRAGGTGGTRLQRALAGTFGADISEGLTSKILKPFTITEVNNYYQSIMGGRLFMEEMVDRLKGNPADGLAVRKMQALGFNAEEIAGMAKSGLTDEQAKLGALRFWKKSQAIPDFLNTPEFFQSGWGKIFNQFKGVAYNQSRNIWDGAFKELKAGNPYPLIILATIFPTVGEIIGDVKSILKGKGPGSRPDTAVARYFANMGEAFGIGMAYDLFNAAKDPNGFVNYWAGPSFTTISSGLNSLYKTTTQGKGDLFKFLIKQIPFVGNPLDEMIFPSKANAQTLSQDLSGSSGVLHREDAQRFADNPIPGVTQKVPGITPSKDGIVAGVDITNYATDPSHEKRIAQIYDAMDAQTPKELTAYIQKRAPKSRITGEMIYQAGQTYQIDPKLITAIIQNDSGFGTKGKGARGFNPGNVGNNDRGQTIKYTSWQEGVNAVARFLSKNRV